MKVLLITPPGNPDVIGGDDVFIYEPLGLEYLAGAVRDQHDVRIQDFRMDRETQLEDLLEEYKPDVVGLTADSPDVPTVYDFSQRIKAKNDKTHVVVGGHHAKFRPFDFYRPDTIDSVVIGEGVFSFRELIQHIEKDKPLDDIAGIAYPGGDGQVLTASRPQPRLDDYPGPARDLVQAHRSEYHDKLMKPIASVRSTVGCPYRCNFCSLWPFTDGRYLTREIEKVVEEIAALNEPNIFFTDDEALIDRKRMTLLVEKIEEAGLNDRNYFMYIRSDSIMRNQDLVERWADAGLALALVGFESFMEGDLSDYNKSNTVKNNWGAIRLLQRLGVKIAAQIVIRPDYTHEDFARVKQFVEEAELATPTFTILTPLPGTPLFDKLDRENILTSRNWGHYDLMHAVVPTKLPIEEFYEEFFKLPHEKYLQSLFAAEQEKPEAEKIAQARKFFSVIRAHRKKRKELEQQGRTVDLLFPEENQPMGPEAVNSQVEEA